MWTDEIELWEGKKTSFDPEMCGYTPSGDIDQVTYYDFVGKLLEYKKVQITDASHWYILRVMIIKHEEDLDFFTLDVFVNEQNMRIEKLKEWMMVTGALWFQGEIA